jgi:hypothetical protein
MERERERMFHLLLLEEKILEIENGCQLLRVDYRGRARTKDLWNTRTGW